MEEHGQLHESAISAESVKTGVVNDERFETMVADYQGFGVRHDPATCKEPACGHTDHGKSTRREPSLEPKRVGELNDGQGDLVRPITVLSGDGTETTRFEPRSFSYDPDIAKGDKDALEAIDHDPDLCAPPQPYTGGPVPRGRAIVNGHLVCIACNRVDDAAMDPEYTISKGGGSGSGRRKKSKTGGAALPPYIMVSYETEEARERRHAGGRKPKGPRSRNKTLSVKVSEQAHASLQEPGAKELIDELGFAIQNGMTIAQARERLGFIETSEAA